MRTMVEVLLGEVPMNIRVAKEMRRAHVIVLAVRCARRGSRQGSDVPRNRLRNTRGLHAMSCLF